jgi:GNAT superfamily N-acetyltransferase
MTGAIQSGIINPVALLLVNYKCLNYIFSKQRAPHNWLSKTRKQGIRVHLARRLTVKETEYCGYYPGVIGKITEVHAVYYNQHWGFDVSFETQEGRELANFIMEFNETRDGLWVAKRNNMFAGSVAIDGRQAIAEGARLRWFIVVPVFQGLGIGKELISRAVEFCKHRRYPKVYLWTFEGLDTARSIYEKHNFRLCEEHKIDQWGQHINEQKFELTL